MSLDISSERVHEALSNMYSGSSQNEKLQAMSFLEKFQKSDEAWEISHSILSDKDEPLQYKMIAAHTLRFKIHYDLSQVPESSIADLKDSVISLMATFSLRAQRVVLIQLSIALAQLALQYLNWNDPVGEVITKLSQSEELVPCLLQFLKVLPEELSGVNKTFLSDEEFNKRTSELINFNVEKVLLLLKGLAEAPNAESLRPAILDCLNSWIKESPVEGILSITTFTDLIFRSLTVQDSFDQAIDCLCTIVRETRDIENYEVIDALYKQLININEFAHTNKEMLSDPDVFSGLTRLYVEAGESWHVLIAKNSKHFKPLVQILLECCKYDDDLDVVRYTFYFWFLLKQMICLDKFQEAKNDFQDIYSALISVIIKHLEYPINPNDSDDLFDGDREQEDKFKEFRYEMGDVLKDCCAVVGAQVALNIPFQVIQSFISLDYKNMHWQQIEAPLFSMRTMAKEVSVKENTILPTIMNMLIQLPEHPKIRYAATLVLGRYSLWTANNPSFLGPQLDYIIKGFDNSIIQERDKDSYQDILKAASHALMFLCEDCAPLLVDYLEQLYFLYMQVSSRLDNVSLFELAEGLAFVIKRVPTNNVYNTCEIFWKPSIEVMKNSLETRDHSKSSLINLGDQIELLSVFVNVLSCHEFGAPSYPVCDLYMKEVWPLLSQLSDIYSNDYEVSERIWSLVRYSIRSFSTYLLPVLQEIAHMLHEGFKKTNYSFYLWTSGTFLREFGGEYTSEDIKEATFQFGLSQCSSFFAYFNNFSGLKDMPDVIEQFFHMADDLIMYFPVRTIPNAELLQNFSNTTLRTLTLCDQFEPLASCLYFNLDLVAWGFADPPISIFESTPPHIRDAIAQYFTSFEYGANIVKTLVEGLIFHFPPDLHDDTVDLLLKILIVVPDTAVSINWLFTAALSLPNAERKQIELLISTLSVALPNKDMRRARISIRSFTDWYSRKHISARTEF